MNDWQLHPITLRLDGSYGIIKNGLPYHVPNMGEWAELHAQVAAYAAQHPDQVTAETPPPPPTPEQIVREFTLRVQRRLDRFAASEGRFYDNMRSACSYSVSKDPVFSLEGAYCIDARDATWNAANAVMNAVLAGTRDIPTWPELEAELPPLAWPE